jgi:ACT domain-containing protein
MSRTGKMKFIRLIEGADMSISDALAKYDVPRSTYYRWKRNLKVMGTKGLAKRVHL